MAKRYRVIHQRRSIWDALMSGRGYRDCYLAQAQMWWGWRTLATFPTQMEAESACSAHAGGTLLKGGDRVVAEFERPE